jgi:ribonucleoside-diphosphate reductase alpha chain
MSDLKESIKTRLIRKKVSLNDTAKTVLEKRYLIKDKDGVPLETVEDLFFRVAENIASAEKIFNPKAKTSQWIEKFYNMMADLEFLPNSPTLMNAGLEMQQLSACFVLPVEDSMNDIFTTIKNTALIHQSGGGSGFTFGNLRPKNDKVSSTGGFASGPLSFMEVFDKATSVVAQAGKRRGANMGILPCHHPDILDFIEMKSKDNVMSNFNISVAITDEFMNALKADSDYPLINPRNGKEVTRLKAKEVFEKIVQYAWKNGEPGLFFIDTVEKTNPTPHIGKLEATNPCGELPLIDYECCNLGSINLAKFIKVDEKTKGNIIDFAKLKNIVHTAVRFLDNVIEVNKTPLPEIEKISKANRKIGLGIMGYADMLILLGIKYNSKEGLGCATALMEFINKEAHIASKQLAHERGVFPNFKGSIHDGVEELRNATLTTIAPTGTISMIAGCSSGIEPLFSVAYTKTVMDGTAFNEINPYFENMAKKRKFYSEDLIKKIVNAKSLKDIKEIPQDIKDLFVVTHDITPQWHINTQAAFQKHVDNSISKTINFPHDATITDVEDAFKYAYATGCKGITIYRDGSRQNQVLTAGKKENSLETTDSHSAIKVRSRPSITKGCTYKTKTGCGTLYITINSDEEGLCEVFTQMGKSGGCTSSNTEAISRLISLALRSGTSLENIATQLRGIRCPSAKWHEGKLQLSCADAIGQILSKVMNSEIAIKDQIIPHHFSQCVECGGEIENSGGCFVCKSCGSSKCG